MPILIIFLTIYSTNRGVVISAVLFTMGLNILVVSTSWKESVPILERFVWPVMANKVERSLYAVANPVVKFKLPGPDVAMATAISPLTL